MGLTIHSLGELPLGVERDYFIYLLDYGWEEPVADAMFRNFEKMADLASRHGSVVLRGVVGSHFEDEVLSWHHVNGQDGEQLLPAILITTRHPDDFRRAARPLPSQRGQPNDSLLLIPLRSFCTSPADVVPLIERIFNDIQEKRALTQFAVAEEMKAAHAGAVVDALILKPNFGGLGIDLNRIVEFFRSAKRTLR